MFAALSILTSGHVNMMTIGYYKQQQLHHRSINHYARAHHQHHNNLSSKHVLPQGVIS